jgi:hypothetical protein
MKITILINEDVVEARIGTYSVSAKADIPEDPKACIETLLEEHILYELLEELAHEII